MFLYPPARFPVRAQHQRGCEEGRGKTLWTIAYTGNTTSQRTAAVTLQESTGESIRNKAELRYILVSK
eukprot:scaffold616086_cov42-Prasinocladus_malaysianus.AAC.1